MADSESGIGRGVKPFTVPGYARDTTMEASSASWCSCCVVVEELSNQASPFTCKLCLSLFSQSFNGAPARYAKLMASSGFMQVDTGQGRDAVADFDGNAGEFTAA